MKTTKPCESVKAFFGFKTAELTDASVDGGKYVCANLRQPLQPLAEYCQARQSLIVARKLSIDLDEYQMTGIED